MSVKDIVEELKTRDETLKSQKKEDKIRREEIEFSNKVEGEVNLLISDFEKQCFDYNSSERRVAELIHIGDKYYLDNTNDEAIFDSATSSETFINWKNALEEKFDIKIYIYRHHSYETRYSNSGYAVGSDSIFEGVKASIDLNK